MVVREVDEEEEVEVECEEVEVDVECEEVEVEEEVTVVVDEEPPAVSGGLAFCTSVSKYDWNHVPASGAGCAASDWPQSVEGEECQEVY